MPSTSRTTRSVARTKRIGSARRVLPSKPKPKSAARSVPETLALVERLGKRCKALRNDAGLTQQRAAELAGIAIAQVQVVERGTGNPTVAILAALSRVYGVSVAELFKGV